MVQSFIERLVNSAVREWSGEKAEARSNGRGFAVASAWYYALGREDEVDVPPTRQRSLTRFYQAWQSWTYQEGLCRLYSRLCFLLEPPYDDETSRVITPSWTLRYFYGRDDPSLLVPAAEAAGASGNVRAT